MRRNRSALLFLFLVLPFWAGHDLLHAAGYVSHEASVLQCGALHSGSVLSEPLDVPEPDVFSTPEVQFFLPAGRYAAEKRQIEVRGPPAF
jgi:hypothetical protein